MDFINSDDLSNDQNLFNIAFAENALADAWEFPASGPTFLPLPDHVEGFGDGHPGQGIKRPRGRTFTGCITCRERKIKCDGRRPVCYNCQRSRGHICRGFIENSRHTAVGEDTSEPIAKTRRTGNRRDSSQEIWDQVLGQSAVTGPTQAGIVSRQRQLSLGDDARQAPSISPRLARAPVGQTSPDDQSNDDLLDYYKHIVTGVMMPTIDPSSNP